MMAITRSQQDCACLSRYRSHVLKEQDLMLPTMKTAASFDEYHTEELVDERVHSGSFQEQPHPCGLFVRPPDRLWCRGGRQFGEQCAGDWAAEYCVRE